MAATGSAAPQTTGSTATAPVHHGAAPVSGQPGAAAPMGGTGTAAAVLQPVGRTASTVVTVLPAVAAGLSSGPVGRSTQVVPSLLAAAKTVATPAGANGAQAVLAAGHPTASSVVPALVTTAAGMAPPVAAGAVAPLQAALAPGSPTTSLLPATVASALSTVERTAPATINNIVAPLVSSRPVSAPGVLQAVPALLQPAVAPLRPVAAAAAGAAQDVVTGTLGSLAAATRTAVPLTPSAIALPVSLAHTPLPVVRLAAPVTSTPLAALRPASPAAPASGTQPVPAPQTTGAAASSPATQPAVAPAASSANAPSGTQPVPAPQTTGAAAPSPATQPAVAPAASSANATSSPPPAGVPHPVIDPASAAASLLSAQVGADWLSAGVQRGATRSAAPAQAAQPQPARPSVVGSDPAGARLPAAPSELGRSATTAISTALLYVGTEAARLAWAGDLGVGSATAHSGSTVRAALTSGTGAVPPQTAFSADPTGRSRRRTAATSVQLLIQLDPSVDAQTGQLVSDAGAGSAGTMTDSGGTAGISGDLTRVALLALASWVVLSLVWVQRRPGSLSYAPPRPIG